MTDNGLVEKTAEFVKKKFEKESSGHDWWHIYRVWQLAKHIASFEKDADLLVVELAALLHDIADWKFTDEIDAGPKAAREWLDSLSAPRDLIAKVEDIVRHISYKGANVKSGLSTLEGYIVHDADKLDAMGAIGIARCFAFGGWAEHKMYDPAQKPVMHDSFEDYQKMESSSITHFYEKLLLLKERMFTETGKQMAEQRHRYMEGFLKEFYAEWDGRI
jgi:uncharacterized protein